MKINVVLYEPEIPQNTGNIMRTCSAFNMSLHLIEPLGFRLDEKHLLRAGMDYIEELDWQRYHDWDEFYEAHKGKGQFVYFSRYGLKSFKDCVFNVNAKEIYLLFGKESTGIPKTVLKDHLEETYRLPMRANARSLNLSNCVAIGAYECLRQVGFGDLSLNEVIKGKDWLLK